jgi:hypothetical protein
MSGSQYYQSAGYDFSLLANGAGSVSTDKAIGLRDEVFQYNNDEFKGAFLPSVSTSDSAINMGRLVGRNNSLSDISKQLYDENTLTQNSYLQAKDTYTRQGEINEWQAQNKLDTLFFLQILFLFFSVLVVLLYLRQGKMLSGTAVFGTAGILLLVVIGILWNRVSYTNMSRDSRYWNRRYIAANPNALGDQCTQAS